MTEPIATLPVPSVAIAGRTARFPVRRLYCIGRNYADHAREMGFEPDLRDLFFFTKWADTVRDSGSAIAYPPGTADLHHEVELVVAIGRPAFRVARADAPSHVWGYAVGLDLTRRDLQLAAREKSRPWDAGKNFDAAAPIGPLSAADSVPGLSAATMRLDVNGAVRQQTVLDQMLFGVDVIVEQLSRLYRLELGDLIMTGTPAGVGPLKAGDRLRATIEGLSPLEISIGEP